MSFAGASLAKRMTAQDKTRVVIKPHVKSAAKAFAGKSVPDSRPKATRASASKAKAEPKGKAAQAKKAPVARKKGTR